MNEKKCGSCIHFKQYISDCTGEYGNYSVEGWIGTNTPACERYWNRNDICLVCKHWDSIRFKDKSTHWGLCDLDGLGQGAHKCECHCSKFERREDYKEYLERIVRGEE